MIKVFKHIFSRFIRKTPLYMQYVPFFSGRKRKYTKVGECPSCGYTVIKIEGIKCPKCKQRLKWE